MNAAKKISRVDLRITSEQKKLFELASSISGYGSLSSYITSTMQEKSRNVLKEHNEILTSNKDREVFFNALTSDIEPNNRLKRAAKNYKKLTHNK